MFKRFIQLVMMFVIMTLVACGSPEATLVAEVVPTITSSPVPIPTDTAVPPTDTPTAKPTNTSEPTNTATTLPTETPTKVPTNTPEATDTAVPTNTAVPPTNTPVAVATNPPAPPASLPASGSPPQGSNLVVNPGFEYGGDGWRRLTTDDLFTTNAYPQFVHSGSAALRRSSEQLIEDLQPGTTYRLGAWLKVWASNSENRETSNNPGDYFGRVCISDEGPNPPKRYCSAGYRPIDSWQYITVDAVPTSNRVVIFLSYSIGANESAHFEIMWDDVEFGLSPVTATATPPPLGRPYPPAPVLFNASTMRDNMNHARSMLEQMGGLLDRIYRGSREACGEYDGYYRSLVGSARYDGVPAEWQGVYNEYIFAVENGSNTNQPIFDLCFEHGGGGITDLNYGVAREGINSSLNRLIPAIETAKTLP